MRLKIQAQEKKNQELVQKIVDQQIIEQKRLQDEMEWEKVQQAKALQKISLKQRVVQKEPELHPEKFMEEEKQFRTIW